MTVTAVVISLACIGAIAWMISKGVMEKKFVHPKQDCRFDAPEHNSEVYKAEEKTWPAYCSDGLPKDEVCDKLEEDGTDNVGRDVRIKCKCCD